MEDVQVDIIYSTLLDSNEEDLSPHASQTIYFSNMNENKISDRGTPVKLFYCLTYLSSIVKYLKGLIVVELFRFFHIPNGLPNLIVDSTGCMAQK